MYKNSLCIFFYIRTCGFGEPPQCKTNVKARFAELQIIAIPRVKWKMGTPDCNKNVQTCFAKASQKAHVPIRIQYKCTPSLLTNRFAHIFIHALFQHVHCGQLVTHTPYHVPPEYKCALPLAPTRLTRPLSEHAPRAYSNEPQAAPGPRDAPTIHGTLIDTKILAQNEDKPPTWNRATSRGEHHAHMHI